MRNAIHRVFFFYCQKIVKTVRVSQKKVQVLVKNLKTRIIPEKTLGKIADGNAEFHRNVTGNFTGLWTLS